MRRTGQFKPPTQTVILRAVLPFLSFLFPASWASPHPRFGAARSLPLIMQRRNQRRAFRATTPSCRRQTHPRADAKRIAFRAAVLALTPKQLGMTVAAVALLWGILEAHKCGGAAVAIPSMKFCSWSPSRGVAARRPEGGTNSSRRTLLRTHVVVVRDCLSAVAVVSDGISSASMHVRVWIIISSVCPDLHPNTRHAPHREACVVQATTLPADRRRCTMCRPTTVAPTRCGIRRTISSRSRAISPSA